MEQQAWMAGAMGVETSNMSAEVAAQAAQKAMTSFVQNLDLPTRLRDVGLSKKDICSAAKLVGQSHATSTIPRKAGTQDYMALMQAAY